jgi:NADPH:quinone reductase-like Zn-dependent oxidoreductase
VVEVVKALVLNVGGSESPLKWTDWPDPVTQPGWVTVRVLAAGLNRNDSMNIGSRTSRSAASVIGADGAGVVAEVGGAVTGWEVGDEVVVLPSLWWGASDLHPGERFEILGDVTAGTFAEYVTVPAGNVYHRPERLSWRQCAVLPLAGVTAWRALITQGALKSGQRLLVTGASGGVATFAIQMGEAIGADVYVTTSSPEKLDDAIRLGASGGVIREPGWEDALAAQEPFHMVLDSSGASWSELISSLGPAGTLVSIGRTRNEHAEIPIHSLFIGQRRVVGSTMGSPREFGAFLQHLNPATWTPLIDSTFEFADADEAFARLDSRDRMGKIVLNAVD